MSTHIEVIRERLADVCGDIDMAREYAKMTAVSSLQRTAAQLEAEIARLETEAAATRPAAELLTEEDAREQLASALADLPPHERREIAALVSGVLSGVPVLSVVEGG